MHRQDNAGVLPCDYIACQETCASVSAVALHLDILGVVLMSLIQYEKTKMKMNEDGHISWHRACADSLTCRQPPVCVLYILVFVFNCIPIFWAKTNIGWHSDIASITHTHFDLVISCPAITAASLLLSFSLHLHLHVKVKVPRPKSKEVSFAVYLYV